MTFSGGIRRARREPWGDLVAMSREEALAATGPLPGEAVALLTSRDEASGTLAAQVMLRRAGRPLRVVLAHGCGPGIEAGVVNALARRLEARLVVIAAAPTFAAAGWLSRAEAALAGRRAVAFETGRDGARAPRAVALDGPWAARRLGGAILRPELDADAALRDLLAAAHAEGGVGRDPAAVLLDLEPSGGRAAPGTSSEVVDARDLGALDPGPIETTAVVLPCIDPERGRAAADRLAERAGAPARILVVLDTERRGFVATLNAVAPRLGASRLAYVAEDAFPGEDWLARGLEALEAPGIRLAGLNCGKWDGRVAAFGLMRLDWARALYGGPVMHPGYRAHRADNELTAIARAQGAYAYAPSALVIEADARKALRSGENAAANFDPADRKLFRRRFRTAFDGLAPRGPLCALAPDYLNPEQALAASAALEAADR